MQHENIPGILEEIQSRIAAMRDSMRVDENSERLKELEAKMGEANFWDNQDTANEIIAELKRIKARIDPVQAVAAKIEDAQILWDMAQEMDDDESREEVDAQIDGLHKDLDKLEMASLLSGKYDGNNCYLSIQSGAGGTEADDWCEMLMRMYLYYCEKQGWDVSEYSKTHGTEAGSKGAERSGRGLRKRASRAPGKPNDRPRRPRPKRRHGRRASATAQGATASWRTSARTMSAAAPRTVRLGGAHRVV